MGKLLLVALAILSLIARISATSVICYHGTWSHTRLGNGEFKVSDVPANLCTHYIYAFVGLDSKTSEVILLDDCLDISLGQLSNAVALKKVNPDLKVLIAVGGWNEGSAKYSSMAADATKRATFIASALSLVQTYGFDGFDLDWEYPGQRDSTNPNDKENFSLLIKEFHQAFSPLGLLVSAAVSATLGIADTSYEVPVLSQYLDFINVMTYDFHAAWETNANHNAPLYSASRFVGTEYANNNVNASIQGWLARGASPSKLALGVPIYGRTFILSNASNNAPGSSTTGSGGDVGPYTTTSGFWGYNEIIEKFNEGGWTTAWDDEQQVPYAYNEDTWLSYDNAKSLALKVAYAKSLGLGAIMLWSLETDDFKGLGGTHYPLLTAINNGLGLSVDDFNALSSTFSEPATPSLTLTKSHSSLAASPSTMECLNNPDLSSIADGNFCSATGHLRSASN